MESLKFPLKPAKRQKLLLNKVAVSLAGLSLFSFIIYTQNLANSDFTLFFIIGTLIILLTRHAFETNHEIVLTPAYIKCIKPSGGRTNRTITIFIKWENLHIIEKNNGDLQVEDISVHPILRFLGKGKYTVYKEFHDFDKLQALLKGGKDAFLKTRQAV